MEKFPNLQAHDFFIIRKRSTPNSRLKISGLLYVLYCLVVNAAFRFIVLIYANDDDQQLCIRKQDILFIILIFSIIS